MAPATLSGLYPGQTFTARQRNILNRVLTEPVIRYGDLTNAHDKYSAIRLHQKGVITFQATTDRLMLTPANAVRA